MDLSHSKEQFSLAYMRAVSSTAGFGLESINIDLDGIDLTIVSHSRTGKVRSPKLDVQVKATAEDVIRGQEIRYPLKRKNYDDLIIDNFMVPRILVVVLVPANPEEWLDQSEEQLAMRHCGYWVSLRGLPPTDNESTVTVKIPRSQVFSVGDLRSIMARIGEGTFL